MASGLESGMRGWGTVTFRLVECQAEFSRENNVVAIFVQGFAEKVLVGMRVSRRAIYFSRVEQRVAYIHGIFEHLSHFALVGRETVAVAHAHTAEAHGRNTQAAQS